MTICGENHNRICYINMIVIWYNKEINVRLLGMTYWYKMLINKIISYDCNELQCI